MELLFGRGQVGWIPSTDLYRYRWWIADKAHPTRGLFRGFGLADRPLLDVAADVPDRLAQALLVFHQGDAHVAFAAFAEGPAGGDGDFGLLDQVQREVDRALAAQVLLGHFGPDEHAGAGLFHLQPSFVRPSHRTSRRDWYFRFWAAISLSQCRMAMMPAIWIAWNMP